jgi:16S rRNA processing protein RimM
VSFTEYLGVISRTHGLDGTVVLTDLAGLSPELSKGTVVGVGYSRDHVTMMTVSSADITTHRVHLRFEGVHDPQVAATFIDKAVYLTEETAGTKDQDRYTVSEIEGCTVVKVDGTTLGTITDVWLLPANDVWVVTNEGGDTTAVPVVDEFVRSIDLTQRIITVDLPDGLTNLDRSGVEGEHGEQ